MSEEEFDSEARPVFRSVFASDDPFDAPFQSQIQPRLLLYGFRWVLHEPWLDPIADGVAKLEEDGFYLTVLSTMLRGPEPNIDARPYHWFVPLSEAGTYKSGFGMYASALCSTRATWGLISSYEDHAIIGGSSSLIDTIRRAIPDLDARVREFLDIWRYNHEKYNADIGWMPRMLEHTYGPETMRLLLTHAELDWLLRA
jgi:hypothetical protein